jgi:D-beta-D-heptose 7-phosphate kinase/D-beta-D-heptose 1-phosphate adenosyltransferase
MSLSVPDFSSLEILVGGDAMLDEYWFGDARRISPEAPVPVVHANYREQRPGGAANVAVNLAALGARVYFVGAVGDDASGSLLAELLRRSGVEPALVTSESIPTIHKLRVLARNQQLIRLDAERTLEVLADEVNRAIVKQARGKQFVVLSDYGKGTLANIADLIESLNANGCRVLIDPKGTDFKRYRKCFCLTPNQAEFAAVAGDWDSESEFLDKAKSLREELDLDFLLVTRSERGMTMVGREIDVVDLAAEAKEVFDVTGAGDSVIATLAAGWGVGLPAQEAVALANLAASLVVARIGVASVTPAELKAALHRRGFGGRGLVTADELGGILDAAKERGDRIVMTNGCFDILHAGHVSYLEEAKSLGDQLVVAVNDDASVARLKGDSRPITPLEDRMAVLAGLAAVDWVVPFSDDTPAALIEQLKPDILVKGGDWNVDQIAGADSVIANGGEVRVLEFKPGRSTTALINAIRTSADRESHS